MPALECSGKKFCATFRYQVNVRYICAHGCSRNSLNRLKLKTLYTYIAPCNDRDVDVTSIS